VLARKIVYLGFTVVNIICYAGGIQCHAKTITVSSYNKALGYLWTGLLNSSDIQFLTRKGRIPVVPANVKGQKAQMDWILLHPPADREDPNMKMSDRSMDLPAVNSIEESVSDDPLSKSQVSLRGRLLFHKTKQLRTVFDEYRTAIERNNATDIASKRGELLELVGSAAVAQADVQLKK